MNLNTVFRHPEQYQAELVSNPKGSHREISMCVIREKTINVGCDDETGVLERIDQ